MRSLLILGLSGLCLYGCTGDLGGNRVDNDDKFNPLADGDPGTVTLHRLNRVEYNNTVRDLLGTSLTPADDFPSDDYGYGFDNIADVLSVSPTHVELYERAAETLINEALTIGIASTLQTYEAEDVGGSVGVVSGSAWNLYSNGEVSFSQPFESAGTYTISARVWQDQAGPDPAQAAMIVAGQTVQTFDVPNLAADPLVISIDVEASAGPSVVAVSFLNDFNDANGDRNLYVDWITVEGPIGAVTDNPLRDALLVCDIAEGKTCARQVLEAFAYRAWRRPVLPEELDRLMSLVDVAIAEGDDVETGLMLALRGVLVSPNFIFRVELDEDPNDVTPHPVNSYELASRLSYFLWGTMPDDELFEAASEDRLVAPEDIEAQVQRMLTDPKADEFVENFVGQWLFTRSLAEFYPDAEQNPGFDDELRDAMAQEAKLFFQDFLTNGQPVTEMLKADFTYLNDRLAEHYGLPAPGSNEFVKVEGVDRGGILGQASILSVTSYPTATSPVKRGKFVLAQLLCSEPPPPPPGVEGELDTESTAVTIKEQLAQHREDPSCAGCHQSMDNIGFGLERFSVTGQLRDIYPTGLDIDTTGELPGAGSFEGYADMAAILLKDPRVGPCITEKLMTYGLGRGVEGTDRPFIEYIDENAAKAGYTLPQVITLIATSEPFRMRRGRETEGGQP